MQIWRTYVLPAQGNRFSGRANLAGWRNESPKRNDHGTIITIDSGVVYTSVCRTKRSLYFCIATKVARFWPSGQLRCAAAYDHVVISSVSLHVYGFSPRIRPCTHLARRSGTLRRCGCEWACPWSRTATGHVSYFPPTCRRGPRRRRRGPAGSPLRRTTGWRRDRSPRWVTARETV